MNRAGHKRSLNRLPAAALPIRVIRPVRSRRRIAGMANTTLSALSDELGNVAAAGAVSVLQGLRAPPPGSGVVHGPDTIVTTARALGREDGLRIRTADGEAIEASLAGWDPATGVAVL